MDQPRVLIVDDEPSVRESLRLILKDRAAITLADCGEAALTNLEQRPFDVVLLDILMPGIDGLEVLERLRARSASPQVIMLTATKTVKTAVRAMKLGAFDYVTKPFDVDELLIIVERAVQSSALMQEVSALRTEVGQRYSFDNVIGRSPGMQAVLDTVVTRRAAEDHRAAHRRERHRQGGHRQGDALQQPARQRPLVAINCAAIPENLLESELFGHERGAFTDAHARKLGHFESAHSGTIFLDEIGEMNPATQAKLLRVLETGTFSRVGGAQPVTVDVRVVAATNRDLDKSMARRQLPAGPLLPPQRRRHPPAAAARPARGPAAAHPPLPAAQERRARPAGEALHREALDVLLRYRWPGNVRELENVIERALALSLGQRADARGSAAAPHRDRPDPEPVRAAVSAATTNGGASLADAVDRLELLLITDALAKADHNQTRAAEILGTTRRILKYKMDKLGIQGQESEWDCDLRRCKENANHFANYAGPGRGRRCRPPAPPSSRATACP